MPAYTFTETAMQQAAEEWGCNCGPSALAFALQTTLEDIRPTMAHVGFDAKRYTSPTMMKNALAHLNVRFETMKLPVRAPDGTLAIDPMFQHSFVGHILSLVRIQWTGPWTAPGANPKWAYRQTHWIATWSDLGDEMVFDCNGGILGFDTWEKQIVPLITDHVPRADGSWFPTHIWPVTP